MIRLLVYLLAPPSGGAEEFCRPLRQLHRDICFCWENEAYAKAAERCEQSFRELVLARNRALGQALTALTAQGGQAQRLEQQRAQAAFQEGERELRALLSQGTAARQELVLYLSDVVPPFSWPQLDLGAFPGLHHPRTQELFRSQRCYREAMEAVERSRDGFTRMLEELAETRAVLLGMHQGASGREKALARLDSLSRGSPPGGRKALAQRSGATENSRSDVTGLAEDARKRAARTDAVAGIEALSSGAPPKRVPRGRLRAADAVADSFRSQVRDQGNAWEQELSAPLGGSAPGELTELFASAGAASASAHGKDPALRRAPSSLAAVATGAEEVLPGGLAAGAADGAGAAGAASAGRESPENAESSLFALVHRRYRAQEGALR